MAQPGQQGQSAGGSPKSEKPQSGTQQGNDKSATGGNPPNSDKKQPGDKGPGGESQLAQNRPKSNEKKPDGSGGSDSQNLPGGEEKKSGEKPKDESGNSQGGGQGSKSKPEEKQGGGGQSDGGEKPKPGQGDQPQSGGGSKPGGRKGGNKGGGDDHAGQKEAGRTGDPSGQNSNLAPDPQTDNAPGEKKTGESNDSGGKPNDPQSPGINEKTSDSKGESPGDRKGGGAGGGGGDEKSKKNGKGTPGSHSAADEGGAVSDQHGPGATGKKAGEEVRATERTGSAKKESGKGGGEKKQSADDQTAKNDSQKPQRRFLAEHRRQPGQVQRRSTGRCVFPTGGQPRHWTSLGRQPTGRLPNSRSSAPRARRPTRRCQSEFSKKQVDLALEHLKGEKAKQKSELLDRLGWTKEEAQKFLENMNKLKDSAQQPGSEAAKAYNEFLKNLDLHPHGTRLEGGKTRSDDMRSVRDSGQMAPPSDWAELYRAYTRSMTEQK